MKTPRLMMIGLLAAILAELCSVGLLAASGWFLAASAVAGLTVGSTFSYIAPSGWVRAFAIGRIALQYAQRLLLHRGALQTTGQARHEFFERAAHSRTPAQRDGSLLDRAVHDTDAVGLSVITVRAPLWAFGGVVLASLVTLAILCPPALIPFVVFAVLAPLGGLLLDRRTSSASARVVQHRQELSSEIVDTVVAWPELVSLGAAAPVRASIDGRLEDYDRRRRQHADRAAVADALLGLLGIAAAVATTAVAVASGVTVAVAVLVFLLLTGVATTALALPAAFAQRRAVAEARERLETPTTWRPATAEGPRVRLAPQAVLIDDYTAPATALRGEVAVHATLESGDVLAITGVSGAGKSMLLSGLGTALRTTSGVWGTVREVPVDDYIFTGTVAENLRLGAPTAGPDAMRAALDEMALVDLLLDTPVGVGGRPLSGGEETRLRLARAVAAEPALLLVDEPTAGLDEDTARLVIEHLCRRSADGILIVAIHDDALLREFAGTRVQTVQL